MRRRSMLLGMTALAPAAAVVRSAPAQPRPWQPLIDYLPADRREEARAGTDRTTDHSVYLQAMLDDGHEYIELGGGKFNLKRPLTPRNNSHWRGRHGATTLRSSIDGYILDARASEHRLGLEDLAIEGDLGNPRSGGFRLFDPATYHVRGVNFSNFNREALRFVQGVLIAAEDCVFLHCGNAAGEAAVFFDPGDTATVLGIIDRCYFAACNRGLRAQRCRALRINDTVMENNVVATELTACDGSFTNSWLEANKLDGDWTDCSGMQRDRVFSTQSAAGNFRYTWSGSTAQQRAVVCGASAFAEMRNSAVRTASGAGRWLDVPFDESGAQYNATPLAGGDPAVLQAGVPGFYRLDYRASLRVRGSRPGSAAVRVVAEAGAGFAEVPGSYASTAVDPDGGAELAGSLRVHLAADSKLKLQWTVDGADVVLSGEAPPGTARPIAATNAGLGIEHLGIER